MSLLLEALKKAELAKHGQASEEPVAPPTSDTLEFPKVDLLPDDPEPVAFVEPEPAPRQPVITRESLPDISQSLDIRSEDLAGFASAPAASPRVQPERRPEAIERAEPLMQRVVEEAPEPVVEAPDPQQQRDAARQMFEVKEVDYNPRKPFYFTVAGLVTAAVCYGGYVWWQMQPRYAINTAAVKPVPPRPAATSTAQAPAPSAEPAVEAAPQPQIAAAPNAPGASPAPTRGSPAPAAPARPPVAGAPARSAEPAAAEARGTTPAARSAVRVANPEAPAPGRAAATPREASRADPGRIAVTPAVAQIEPAIERAYGLYQQGDLNGARAEYERAMERDPLNRDALLGLAAIDVRSRNFETAELRYVKLLELNPRDTHALAALIGLQGNLDPLQSESRIKSLIASQPDATHLYFTLGNLYGSQRRWPEAQDAYFRAYSADPENADYAFNLAVSLDQLRQSRPAAEYYRKAAALAAVRPSAFDRNRAEARARELDR